MNEQKEQTTGFCPCCGRHCDLSAPGCERGETYLKTGQIPERGGREHPQHDHGEPGRYDEHGGHGGRGGHGPHGPHGHGGHHRPDCCGRRGDILGSPHYEAMDTGGKLETLLMELGHIRRFRMEGKGGQNRILHILSEEGTMTQRALTERIGVQSGSASEVLGKLERAGLILRTASEADRRTVDVTLTEQGREQAQGQAREHQARKEAMFASLSPEEQESLREMLERILRDWTSKPEGKPHPRQREE